MFLEPVSQIVAKEAVGAMEMDDSMEKTRLIAEVKTIAKRDRIAENGQAGDFIRLS